MKTDNIILENYHGFPIRRDYDRGLYCATDLAQCAKKYAEIPVNLSQFMAGLKFQKIAKDIHKDKPVIIVGRGRHSATWVAPELLIYIGCNLDINFTPVFIRNILREL